MSIPLKDFRLGISESIDIWLDAEARARRLDKAAIAREVLSEWAKGRMHAFKIAHRRMASNGMQTDWLGDDLEDDGADPADAGIARNARK